MRCHRFPSMVTASYGSIAVPAASPLLPPPWLSKSKDPGIRRSITSSFSSSSSSSDVASLPVARWDVFFIDGSCVFGGDGVVLEEFGASSCAFPVTVWSVAALALLIASENDIEGGVVVAVLAVFVGVDLPDATRPARPARACRGGCRSSGDEGGDGCCCCRCCCCTLVSDAARQDGFVPFSPSSSSSLIPNLSSFTAAAAPPFKRDRTRAAPIAFRQRARGSKFSRRPERSCSVGQAKVVNHGCARACSAVRRRSGSGLSRAWMKFLAV